MNDSFNPAIPKPKKIAVWAEGTHIEAKYDFKLIDKNKT